MKNSISLQMKCAYIALIIMLTHVVSCEKNDKKNETKRKHEEINHNGIKILNYQLNDKYLLFYGSMHSNDPSDPMFDEIEQYFTDFKPEIVFSEGGVRKLSASRDESILNDGEPGLLRFLAYEHNINIENIEPTPQEEFNYILPRYNKNSVYLMYFLRQVIQFQDQSKNKTLDFESYFADFLQGYKSKGFPITTEETKLDHVKALYLDYFGTEFNWETFDFRWIYAYDNILFDIHLDVTTVRDIRAVDKITHALQNYDKVMVVMGSQHAANQKDELISLF